VIDFVLSNLYNSGVRPVFVLLQYKPRPLMDHLAQAWAFANARQGEFIKAVLPATVFKGTADAVHQNLHLIDGADPVAVFAADHVYRMDVRHMAAFHQAHEAMGNYLFRPDALREALPGAVEQGEYDFGQHILPRLVGTHRVYAYDFLCNQLAGVGSPEGAGYWRDIGTVPAFVEAERDLLGPRPAFCLDDPAWPIHAGTVPPKSRERVCDEFAGTPAVAGPVRQRTQPSPQAAWQSA
jgi:glucose-1-phosphate adenylyltransferase